MEEISGEAIRGCQNGHVEAFAEVVGVYERPLHSYVHRLLRGAAPCAAATVEDSEDAVQEIFLKAYGRIRTYDPKRGNRFSTWLFAIARNHCLSLLRRKRIEGERVDLEDDAAGSVADPGSPNPRDAASRREMAGKAAAAVSRLPEDMRSAFVLKHYEEMSYEDVAAVMGCNVGTVKSRVARARERLCEDLKDLLEPPPPAEARGKAKVEGR